MGLFAFSMDLIAPYFFFLFFSFRSGNDCNDGVAERERERGNINISREKILVFQLHKFEIHYQ